MYMYVNVLFKLQFFIKHQKYQNFIGFCFGCYLLVTDSYLMETPKLQCRVPSHHFVHVCQHCKSGIGLIFLCMEFSSAFIVLLGLLLGAMFAQCRSKLFERYGGLRVMSSTSKSCSTGDKFGLQSGQSSLMLWFGRF